MIRTTIQATIKADLAYVWVAVTSLTDFSWRSDITSIAISDEEHFKEISNEGYITFFTVNILNPFTQYAFTMENENLSGEWNGHFKQTEAGTEVQFTEAINLKKWWLYPFAWFYLRNQQRKYIRDLKRKCEQNESK